MGNKVLKKLRSKVRQEGNVMVTVVLIVIVVVLFVTEFFIISDHLRDRSLGRMEEGVQTVISEVTAKLERESSILNATADIISSADNFDLESTQEIMRMVSPLLETMEIRLLMPDNTIITAKGETFTMSETGILSFDEEFPLGEHVSDRMYSADGAYVLRHFVPLTQDGKPAAILYGITRLNELPDALNIDNIYNASASVYIVDTRTGDLLLDTYPSHKELGNIQKFNSSDRQVRGDKKWEEYIDDLMNQGTGYVVYRTGDTRGWDYMYYAPAGINQWSIAVSVPEREAFASVYAVRTVCAVIGAFMAVTVLVYYLIIHAQSKRATSAAVERAVLEEKLKKAEAAERAKTTFLSNMSHDIRTPMNAIIGFTTLAEANLDNKERVQEYLAKIMSSGNHLLSLINDVLDMSRIESGKLNIEERPCTISDIFKDMRNIIQTQMQSKQLNFFMDTMDVVDEEIFCDKLHVNQVLLNLLSNAIKFTPAGGSVALTIRQMHGAPTGYGRYEIRVKDTGIGMSQEFAKRIFEPFERERNSTVSGIQGTGLGMAITKSIVDTMGGTISVETEQDKGTEFIIVLDFRLQTESRQVEVVKELEGLRALVVDDSFSTCDSVTKMLTQIGLRAEWTMHGREAVLRARQAVEMGDEFCAYIIDWALPDLSGLEVVRQVRAVIGNSTPIIILTAYDWTSFEEEAKAAGVTAFCNKPIFLSELRGTLVNAVSNRQPEDEERAQVLPKTAESVKGARLLLVEDNELNREIAVELLKESGFVVETAEDGTVAVEKVKASEPGWYQLILMDIQMPKLDGYGATRAIRGLENPALANIPIVAMTANAFEEDRKRAIECGMNDHVAKPINVETLIRVLNEQLRDPAN